jgi:hypothetical protein
VVNDYILDFHSSNMDIKNLVLRTKYPTLLVMLSLIFISIIISLDARVILLIQSFGGNNYLSFFILGFLTPLGVVTPFAAAFFINTKFENIVLSILLAGVGAVICDFIVFSLLKKFFLKKGNFKDNQLIKLKGFFSDNFVGRKIVTYVSFALAGWIIAAPLPSSIGEKLVTLLSKLGTKELLLVSFLVNTGLITSFVIIGILF